MTFLRVRNWSKWQSYRSDRGQPPWIKLYRALLRDYDWVALSDAEKGQIVSLWLLAADRNGEVPDDARVVARLAQLSDLPDLDRFVELGFMERDAKVTPTRRQGGTATAPASQPNGAAPATARHRHDGLETEAEREIETEAERDPERAREASIAVPNGLVGTINEAFTSRGKHLVLSGEQLMHVQRLAERAGHESDPEDWTRRYLNAAWKLRERGKDVWRGQPWAPSAVCSEKMMVRVIEAMDHQEVDPDMQQFIRSRLPA